MMKKWITLSLSLLMIVLLAVPVSASSPFIYDDAGLLTAGELTELHNLSAEISAQFGSNVYLVTVWDYRDYGEESEIFDVTWNLYHDMNWGCGPQREGMVLLLSMRERDFCTFFYGKNTEYAFNSYGQEQLEDYFLDDFADDNWYGGFRDYLEAVREYLARAEAGDPVRESPMGLAALFVLIACGIALGVTLAFWSRMNNVRTQSAASHYFASNGLCLTDRRDTFMHQTRTRRKIAQSSSGGSRSHSGGGGSGRSGKF